MAGSFIDGYEKVSGSGTAKTGKYPPFSSQGTEEANQGKAPKELDWADRPAKSDPGYT